MKVSIIIPIYNSEKYLDECIQSVLTQTYTNFELLLINDGSTDTSGIICDSYVTRDNRVKVYHKVNGGVSSARNLGLENASGEWITFVDSDDQVLEKFLETITAEIDDVDIVYQGAIKKNRLSQNQIEFENFSDKVINVSSFFQNRMVTSHGFIWGKLFKLRTIKENEIRFETTINLAEDSLFILDYLKYIEKIRFSSKKMYIYYKTQGEGLSSKKYSYKTELNLLNLADEKLLDLFTFHNLNPNTRIKSKELKYYLHRTLESLYKLEKRDRIHKLSYLLEKFQNEFLEIFKSSRGRGRLVFFAVNNKNIRLLDFILNNFIYKSLP